MSMCQPCSLRNARSAMVDLDPGRRMRSASGSGRPGCTILTATSGSRRSGSRSSKLAMRGMRGTAIAIADDREAVVEQPPVAAELVHDEALQQRALLRLQQRMGADDAGDHAAAVDVADQ